MSSSKKAKASKPKDGIYYGVNFGVNSMARGIDGNPIGAGWDLPPSVEKMEQTPQAAVAAAAAAAEKEAEWQNEQFEKLLKRKEKENMARPRFESLAAASASQWGTPALRSDYNSSGGSGEDELLRKSHVPDVDRVLESPYGWARIEEEIPLDVAHSLPTKEEIGKAMKRGGRKKTRRRKRSRKKRTKRRKRKSRRKRKRGKKTKRRKR